MSQSSSISSFMSATLERLAEKEQETAHYPISVDDLAFQDTCPVCGSADLTLVSEVYLNRDLCFFATSVCQQCLFVFRSRFPSFSWFKARWRQISTEDPEVFNQDVEDLRRVRYQTYAELLSAHRQGGRLLEIGAGFGAGAKTLEEAGFEVETLEPEDDRSNYIRNKLGITCHGLTMEEFEPEGTYDIIVCAHNLEHLDHPREQAARLAEWLAPDGLIYCEVPLVWNLVDWADSLFLAHKSNFAESNFARLMSDCGLAAIDLSYPKLNTPEAADFGALMRHGSAAQVSESWAASRRQDRDRSVEDVLQAYRRLPPVPVASDGETIRISVPFIDHFFYVVRPTSGQFVDREADDGFIEFVAHDDRR